MRKRRHELPDSPEQYRGSCRGKVKYTSKKQALGKMRVLALDPAVHSPDLLNVYWCKSCRYWHIGNRHRPRTPLPIIKTIRAHVSEVVDIVWRFDDGSELRERRTPPPPEVKKARQEPESPAGPERPAD